MDRCTCDFGQDSTWTAPWMIVLLFHFVFESGWFSNCVLCMFSKHGQSKCDEFCVFGLSQLYFREQLHNLNFGKAVFEVCKGVMRERVFFCVLDMFGRFSVIFL